MSKMKEVSILARFMADECQCAGVKLLSKEMEIDEDVLISFLRDDVIPDQNTLNKIALRMKR